MSHFDSIVGVDGCEGGWMAAIDSDRGIALEFAEALSELRDRIRPSLLVIDIPIGLMDRGDREADVAARAVLGGRASCVFNAPSRPFLACTSYEEANALSKQINSKGFSKQGFALIPKICEVDALVSEHDELGRVVEGHPEVSFALMNAGVPLVHAKRTGEGFRDRIALLERHLDVNIERLVRRIPPAVREDAVDALALLWTGRRMPSGKHQTLPATPPKDSKGLVMAIHA